MELLLLYLIALGAIWFFARLMVRYLRGRPIMLAEETEDSYLYIGLFLSVISVGLLLYYLAIRS